MDALDHFDTVAYPFPPTDQVILHSIYFLARANMQTNRCSVQRLCGVREMETMYSHGIEQCLWIFIKCLFVIHDIFPRKNVPLRKSLNFLYSYRD